MITNPNSIGGATMSDFQVVGVKVQKAEKASQKCRIYIHPESFSVAQNFIDRAYRGGAVEPHKIYRKLVLPEVLEKLGLPADGVKFGWSRKAGCSCGCSPGFVCNSGHLFGKDVFVTIK
jgi:hypothetical protein